MAHGVRLDDGKQPSAICRATSGSTGPLAARSAASDSSPRAVEHLRRPGDGDEFPREQATRGAGTVMAVWAALTAQSVAMSGDSLDLNLAAERGCRGLERDRAGAVTTQRGAHLPGPAWLQAAEWAATGCGAAKRTSEQSSCVLGTITSRSVASSCSCITSLGMLRHASSSLEHAGASDRARFL